MLNKFIDYLPERIVQLIGYQPGKSPQDMADKKIRFVKLSANEMSLPPSKKVVREMERYAALHSDSLARYPDDWVTELRTSLAALHGIEKDSFLITNGSNEAIVHVCRLLLETGGEAICSQHCFIVFPWALKLLGNQLHQIPTLDNSASPFQQDLQGILKKVNKKTRLIYLANPDNPSGSYFSTKEFIDFLKRLPSHVMVMADQAYFEFVSAKDCIDYTALMKTFHNLMVLRTFSKAHGLAQLRVGYICAQPEIIYHMKKTKIAFGVNGLASRLARASLQDTSSLRSRVAEILTNRTRLCEFLHAHGIEYAPSQGNFITFKHNRHVHYESLVKQGVIARQLKEYCLPDYTRITIGSDKEMKKVHRAITTLLKQVD